MALNIWMADQIRKKSLLAWCSTNKTSIHNIAREVNFEAFTTIKIGKM